MEIRPATVADLDAVMAIYDYARQRMAESGNPSQWIDGYQTQCCWQSRRTELLDVRPLSQVGPHCRTWFLLKGCVAYLLALTLALPSVMR